MIETLDVLPCGYLSFKDDGTITTCNVTLANWLGYPKADLEEKKIENILTLASRIFYNTHFFPLIRLHSETSEIFLSLKGKNEKVIPVLANAKRSIEGGSPVIHCVFIRVEERNKYEEELLKAKREAEDAERQNKKLIELSKSLELQALELDKHYRHQVSMNENLLQFSKIVSHDLQEPIRKIQLFIDQIVHDNDTTLSQKSKMLSAKIQSSAMRLKTLTTSLQEYVVVDNEKLYQTVDLNEVIRTAKNRAANRRKFSDFDLEIGSSPVIEGYPKQLELLFFHLFDNAIQFRHRHRRLSIKVSYLVFEENVFRVSSDRYQYEDHIRISFEDNGIGFGKEYHDYVFQLFKKLDGSTLGLGIGLPLVKRIVQNHLGEIRVWSAQDKGSRFEIELPVRQNGGRQK